MKILLLNHPIINVLQAEVFQDLNNCAGKFIPLGLLSVAAYLKSKTENIDIKVIDCSLENIRYSELEKLLIEYQPEIIGISTYLHSLVDLKLTLKLIKNKLPDAYICLGGANTRYYAQEMLNYNEVNAVIIGDGEIPFYNLINALKNKRAPYNIDGIYFKNENKIIKNKMQEIETNLDIYPLPDRKSVSFKNSYSALANSKNFTTIVSSRGCPYNCKFCIIAEKTYRVRSIEKIIEEMKECINLGIDYFMFNDDVFNANYKRTFKLVNEIKNVFNGKIKWSARVRINNLNFELLTAMKTSGCHLLQLGIESGSNECLKDIGKNITVEQINKVVNSCNKLKILTMEYFMIGLPCEKTKKQISNNIKYSIALKCDYIFFGVFTPYPFSEYFDEGEKKNICSYTKWRDYVINPSINFEINVWTEFFSKDELFGLLRYAYLKFYLQPRNIIKILGNIKKPADFFQLFKTLINVIRKK